MMVLSMFLRLSLSRFISGLKVFSRESNLDTQKIMLDLSGETVTWYGFFIPRVLQTAERRDFVAVAVSARTQTPGGSKLRTSPRWANSVRKSSPLQINIMVAIMDDTIN